MYLASGNLYFTLGNGTGDKTGIDEVGQLNNNLIIQNRWYHTTIIFDKSEDPNYRDTISCYIDGRFIKSMDVFLGGTYPRAGEQGSKRELIGASYGGSYWNMDGFVDEVKVWTFCLSPEEVELEYERGFGEKADIIDAIDIMKDPYFAKGDGITDDSGAIQQAIDDSNSSGQTILLQNGVFLINTPIRLKPFTDLKGENATLLNGSVQAGEFLVVDNKCTISDLIIDCSDQDLYAVSLPEYSTDIDLHNLVIQNLRGVQVISGNHHPYGLWIKNQCRSVHVNQSVFQNISILGSKVTGTVSCRGIEIGDVDDVLIENSTFYNITSDSGFDADCIHIQTINPDQNNDNGQYFWNPSYVTTQNCLFYNFSWRAIKLQCSNATVQENYISAVNPYSAIELFGDSTLVSANKIYLDVPFTSSGVAAARATNSTISYNIIEVDELSVPAPNKIPQFIKPYGIRLYETDKITIKYNKIRSKAGLIFNNNKNTNYSTNCVFTDNVLDVDDNDFEVLFGDDPGETNTLSPNELGESTDFSVKKVVNQDKQVVYSAIQDAIDAASPGDEIVVYPGVYEERLDFGGKAITVRSFDPNNPVVVAATIVDANDLGRVVTFNKSETSASILDGLTLQGGSVSGDGGGIYCYGSSPTIRNCVIIGNDAVGTDNDGGGICIDNGGDPIIEDCQIIGNTAADKGGGIQCKSSGSQPQIRNCTISGNTAVNSGGGIRIYQSPNY